MMIDRQGACSLSALAWQELAGIDADEAG